MSGRGALRVGRLAGIPIGVHPLWLVIVGLLTVELGGGFYPERAPGLSPLAAYALGLASALVLFAGILAHELGHAVVARRRGVVIEEIDLWLLGGVARMSGEPRRPGDELRFALAGPAVTLGLLVIAAALRLASGGADPWVRAFLDYQVYVSAAIVAFNLLPAFPLDGGRVARALLWRRLDDHDRATVIAARGGRAVGFTLVVLGAVSLASGVLGGLWLTLVGLFLVAAAGAEGRQGMVARLFGDQRVAELMTAAPVVQPAAAFLDDAVDAFHRTSYGGFPVVDERGVAVGVLTIEDLRSALATAGGDVRVGAIARRDAELIVSPETTVVDVLGRPAFATTGRAVVVGPDGRPVGVLCMSDVQRTIRSRSLIARRGRAAGALSRT